MVPPAPAAQPGKKDRREEAREKARIEREAEKRRQRRSKIFLQGGIGVAVIAIIAVIALVVVNTNQPSGPAGPGPKNMADGGILFTGVNGVATPTTTAAPAKNASVTPIKTTDNSIAHITTYVDWACPVCQQFETTYASEIQKLVASGEATLSVHTISILDRSFLGTRYASRAANAAACVANYQPDKFLSAQNTFYANQPKESTTGLTNAQIKALLNTAGVTNSAVTACVDKESYKSWVTSDTTKTTSEASLQDSSGQFGTPTVFVNGKRWNNSDDFAAFLSGAVTGTTAPSPSPSN